jgi:hypothetical protein
MTTIDNRRRHGRFEAAHVRCSVGRVVNISGGGVAVLTWRPWGRRRFITFRTEAGPFVVEAERMRLRWRLPLRFEVGFRFVDPPADLYRRLMTTRTAGTITRVI